MSTEQVPWTCEDEWLNVYDQLRSDRFIALGHLKCWNCRMRNALPVGISARVYNSLPPEVGDVFGQKFLFFVKISISC